MFVDEITLYAKAGNGGNGVTRWRHLKFKPKAGPAGGDGGRGGDVYVRAVQDLNILSKYTGDKTFVAQDGESGRGSSQHGKGSEDVYIDLPVGSRITHREKNRSFELTTVGEEIRILKGGTGGRGNEHFKSSTNRSPEDTTEGVQGEEGTFDVELSVIADVGLVGLPNAGKSTLLNLLTRARSAIGAYSFTTLEPHLGSLYGYTVADIPGLIEGAHEGKGLGHKFLRHIARTKMLLHLVSLTDEDPLQSFVTVTNELAKYNSALTQKETWIVLTKKDLVEQRIINDTLESIDKYEKRVFVVSENDAASLKNLSDELVQHLAKG